MQKKIYWKLKTLRWVVPDKHCGSSSFFSGVWFSFSFRPSWHWLLTSASLHTIQEIVNIVWTYKWQSQNQNKERKTNKINKKHHKFTNTWGNFFWSLGSFSGHWSLDRYEFWALNTGQKLAYETYIQPAITPTFSDKVCAPINCTFREAGIAQWLEHRTCAW